MNKGRVEHAQDIQFPVIVKPASEDASKGIDAASVVNSLKELLERIAYVHDEFDSPALHRGVHRRPRDLRRRPRQRPSRRRCRSIELDLSKLPDGMPRIAGYEVKFDVTTEAYKKTKSAPAQRPRRRARRRASSETAAHRLPRPQAPRLRPHRPAPRPTTGKVYVIEANPNPWLDPAAEFAMAAKESGRSYTEMIGEIVELAMRR